MAGHHSTITAADLDGRRSCCSPEIHFIIRVGREQLYSSASMVCVTSRSV
jgi:hypothetical protein